MQQRISGAATRRHDNRFNEVGIRDVRAVCDVDISIREDISLSPNNADVPLNNKQTNIIHITLHSRSLSKSLVMSNVSVVTVTCQSRASMHRYMPTIYDKGNEYRGRNSP